VFIELNHENPILDLTLFKDWNFTFSTIVLFIATIGLFGGIFLIPLFMENLRDYSAMQTGMMMFPAAVTSGLTMPVAARLADRFGAKPLVIIGITLLTLSSLPFVYLDMDTTYSTIMTVMIMRGLGLGCCMMTVTVLGMNTVPLPKISRASSLNNAVRQISGSLGIALLTTVVQDRQIYHLAANAVHINVASDAFKSMLVHAEKLVGGPPGAVKHNMMFYYDYLLQHAGFGPGIIQHKALALISGIVQRQSLIFAFDDAFLVLAVICFCGLLPALLLKPTRVKKGAAPVMGE
jgi:DHA2 family multidrug resistance protein